MSSPAWGYDETTIEVTNGAWGGDPSGYSETVKVRAYCTIRGMTCDCDVQSDLHQDPGSHRYAGCQVVEPRLQPYTNGNLYVECERMYGVYCGNGTDCLYTARGRGTIYTTACGLYPTMSLKFKDGINPFIFGKSVTPVSVQATAGQSSVKDLRIQNYEPLISSLPKDTTTDIFHFMPEIL